MRALVLGAGEVGYHISAKLVQEKAEVVIIDMDPDRLAQIAESLDVQTVTGFAANPETLTAAGLLEADLLVAVTGSDETNILACRIAQMMATSATIRVARIRAAGYYNFIDEKKFRSDLGLNVIINPSREAVNNILDFIGFPGATDVIDVARGRLKLVGMRLPHNHPLLDKALIDLLPYDRLNHILIAAIYRGSELLIPRGDTKLQPGDIVYVVAGLADSEMVFQFFGLNPEPIKEITIVGGGEVGFGLAKCLQAREGNLKVKLIEMNEKRCEYLSARLSKTMILYGDGTDQVLLAEENIGQSDVFIAVSTNDEKNMISCLIAKRLGVRHTITRVNRSSYAPLVAAIGLEAMISARVAAASAILKHIRKGRVISVATLASEDAEIIELQVMPKSAAVGKKLMDLKFPEGALACSLSQGDTVIIPRGNTVIQAGDVMGIVAKAGAVGKLEKILGGK